MKVSRIPTGQARKRPRVKGTEEKHQHSGKKVGYLDSFKDRQEQYARWTCFVFNGLEEGSNENTDQRVINV